MLWLLLVWLFLDQFLNKNEKGSIILEAIVNQSFCIWHIFFQFRNEKNNINVLDWSLLIFKLLSGGSGDLNFVVNGTHPIIIFEHMAFILVTSFHINFKMQKEKHFVETQKTWKWCGKVFWNLTISLCHHLEPL